MTAGLRSLWGCCGLPDTENKDLVVELDSSAPFKFPEESALARRQKHEYSK